MSPSAKIWTAAIAAGLIGVLAGGGIVWGMQQKSPNPAVATADQLAAAKQLADEKDALIASLTEKYNAAVASASVTPSDTVVVPTTGSAVRQFTFVESVKTSGGKTSVVADYAQFLTGKAAADSATAHGDESPPPNDYYIANDNKKLRTLTIKPGISVKLTARDDGTSEPNGYSVSLAKWESFFAKPTDNTGSITAGPYWFTIKDGVVVKIEEQYTP
jgi:hypothetical protein